MNEQASTYDNLRALGGWDIFERRDPGEPGGFKFVCPGVMLGADDVRIDIREGLWHLTYEDSGHTYTGASESQVGAYLALIAARYGLNAVITSAEATSE